MIYLLRQGQTEFNREGRFQGALDSPLTDLGRAQAAAMGVRLKTALGERADWALHASTLGRARQTAAIIQRAIGAPEIVFDARLAEIDMGSWNGLTDDDIEGLCPGARDGAPRYGWSFRSPDGEGEAAFYARLRSWLDEALADGKDRIAVSHGIAGRALCALYTGRTMESARARHAPQDSIFRLRDGRIETL